MHIIAMIYYCYADSSCLSHQYHNSFAPQELGWLISWAVSWLSIYVLKNLSHLDNFVFPPDTYVITSSWEHLHLYLTWMIRCAMVLKRIEVLDWLSSASVPKRWVLTPQSDFRAPHLSSTVQIIVMSQSSDSQILGVVLIIRHGDRQGFYQNPDTYTATATQITPLGNVCRGACVISFMSRVLINTLARGVSTRSLLAWFVPERVISFLYTWDEYGTL